MTHDHHHAQRCPQCNRELTESEIYCYFCELDLAKLRKFKEKSEGNDSKHGHD